MFPEWLHFINICYWGGKTSWGWAGPSSVHAWICSNHVNWYFDHLNYYMAWYICNHWYGLVWPIPYPIMLQNNKYIIFHKVRLGPLVGLAYRVTFSKMVFWQFWWYGMVWYGHTDTIQCVKCKKQHILEKITRSASRVSLPCQADRVKIVKNVFFTMVMVGMARYGL